jgi:hypothetical protein
MIKSMKKIFSTRLHILKHLHNSFVIYYIKYFFSIKVIRQSERRRQKATPLGEGAN